MRNHELLWIHIFLLNVLYQLNASPNVYFVSVVWKSWVVKFEAIENTSTETQPIPTPVSSFQSSHDESILCYNCLLLDPDCHISFCPHTRPALWPYLWQGWLLWGLWLRWQLHLWQGEAGVGKLSGIQVEHSGEKLIFVLQPKSKKMQKSLFRMRVSSSNVSC